ncbi:MAG: ComF family protein [Chloroflexi bacterium]|nr:ComF family protein [Chloroflexota bacterium]
MRYDGAVRLAIHRLKYNGQRALAEPLGDYLSSVAEDAGLTADMIVPLPLHPRRLRQRGYNQSELLARRAGQRLGLPVARAAIRNRDTADQIGLSRRQRQDNVRGAFACCDPDAVRGKRLLLIDDVCTTGSSLFACAAPLLRAGAGEVWGLAVARQDHERA